MGLFESLWFGDGLSVVVECRHCGTSVDAGTARCPACDAEEIATYRIG